MSFLSGIISKAVEIAAPIALNAMFPGSGMLLGAAGNLFAGAIGDAACSMIDQLGKEMGAPKFLTDMAKDAVRSAVQQYTQPMDSDLMDMVRHEVGDKIQDFKSQLM